jgi:hypothetical protein
MPTLLKDLLGPVAAGLSVRASREYRGAVKFCADSRILLARTLAMDLLVLLWTVGVLCSA